MLAEGSYMDAMLGLCIPIAGGWLLYCIGAVGAGDLKLLAVVGLFMGAVWLSQFLIWFMILSGIYSLIKLLYHKNFLNRFRYFFQYLKKCYQTGCICEYYNSKKDGRKPVIHLASVIFCAFLLTEFMR